VTTTEEGRTIMHKLNPLAHDCGKCGAIPGAPCVTVLTLPYGTVLTYVHIDRRLAAMRAIAQAA
jgi:hypothetical protein